MFRLIATLVTAVLVMTAIVFLAARFAPSDPAVNDGKTIVIAAGGDEARGGDDGGEGGKLVIQRDHSGQFRLDAGVNGDDATFLVDTGADLVAVGPEEAERLGIAFDPARFQPIMQTAGGEARGLVSKLDRLEIAGRELTDIDVAVVEGLETNLLGQSALRRLGRITIRGDRMTIGR